MDQSDQASRVVIAFELVIFFVLVASAELVTIFLGVVPGAILDGILLVILVNFSYFAQAKLIRQIFSSLSLVPLLRLLSLAMPILNFAPIYWYVLIGLPLLISSLIIIRIDGLPSISRKLSMEKWFSQVLFGLAGIPIGVIAGFVLPHAAVIIPNPSLGWIILAAIILTVFSAVTEEIIFRGLVQRAMSYPSGVFGFWISSILYASMFLGTLDPASIIFWGLTGILFGLWVKITDSLWGAIIAHSLINIIFLLLFHLH